MLAGSAELLDGFTSALAAANISATDIFFFSAIKHLHLTDLRIPNANKSVQTFLGTVGCIPELEASFQQHAAFKRAMNQPFSAKNPFSRALGLLRDFFHELYLTLSITPLVSTSDRAGTLLKNHDFMWF